MDMRSIYISNGVGIFILLILLYVSRTKILRHRAEDRVYTTMVVGVLVGCCMEIFSYILDGKVFPGSIALNYAANTYLYCANPLLPFCVLVYVDLGLYGDTKRIWAKYKPQIIVGVFLLALNIVNFFVPVTYYINDSNIYERRPLSYLYYIVILYYLISALALTIRYEKENGARAFFNIWLFLVPIVVGAGLQFMFYGLSLAWLAAAVGLAGLFMMQQNELAYIDALVDTYNRQYLNHVLSAWITRGRTFAGAMVDIDNFKGINDTFGHTEGDRALKAVTDILKQSRLSNEWIFRFAGDEFIVLKMADSPDGLADYLAAMERNLAERNRGDLPYPLSLSYGTSFFDNTDIDTFMREMDERMYAMKALHHQAE